MPHHKRDHEKDQPESKNDKAEDLLEQPSYEELIQKLNQAEQKSKEDRDRLLRFQAESENFAKRSKRELENAHKYALEKFANELLPIVDSLELSVINVPANLEPAAQAVIEGAQLTLRMFYTAMDKFGIKQVDPKGEPFNPEFQQAISMQEDANAKPNSVISVLQKGYVLNGRLLRPALVVVAK